jgi:hypothetical protein
MAARGGPSDPRTFGLGPHDAGLGSIRPDQVVGLGPHDAGLGSIRPDQVVGHAARSRRLGASLGRHGFGRLVRL